MRICLLGRVNYELLRQRAEHFASRGHDVHVVSLEEGRPGGWTVHLPRRTGGHGMLRYARAVPFVRRTVAALAPDVVDAHGASSYGLFTLPPLGPPQVLTVYGPDIHLFAARSPALRLAVRAALRGADLVYGSSPAIADYIRDAVGLKLGSRLRTHSWGIRLAEVTARGPERRRQTRQELGVGPATRVIFHCRHIVALSRPGVLVEAMPAVLERQPDTQLWLVYPPPNLDGQRLLDGLEARVAELGLAQSIRFLGPQPHERVISMMHAADVFACIVERDLLASTVLEAMATGLIPVLADLPAYREVIQDGRNGFLIADVTPASVAATLNEVLADGGIQPGLAERNRRLVAASYDAAACSDWLLGRYEELVERGRARTRAAAPPASP